MDLYRITKINIDMEILLASLLDITPWEDNCI